MVTGMVIAVRTTGVHVCEKRYTGYIKLQIYMCSLMHLN